MSWLPLYVQSDDLPRLLEFLNGERDIAYLVADGARRWKAVQTLDALSDGAYALWHRPGGPLPLVVDEGPDLTIEDPFSGWEEVLAGDDPRTPYFGPGPVMVILASVRTAGREAANSVGLTSFEWIGNHYRGIGSPAPDATNKWWARMRRWVGKNASRVPRSGPLDGSNAEIWAFPAAMASFKSGVPRDVNP